MRRWRQKSSDFNEARIAPASSERRWCWWCKIISGPFPRSSLKPPPPTPIAHRSVGFGVPAYLVDSNSALALYQVMSECVARARAGDGPSLIETITYRLGAHSTADDPTKYRTTDELSEWQARDPLLRYRRFLMDRSLLSPNDDELLHEEVDAEIQAAVEELEALPPQDPTVLFDYVYAEPTPQLREQRAALFPG
ncbi:MAG: thiamine pyrophosphate-dependent enzyme [Caldilineaceae bacterium]